MWEELGGQGLHCIAEINIIKKISVDKQDMSMRCCHWTDLT